MHAHTHTLDHYHTRLMRLILAPLGHSQDQYYTGLRQVDEVDISSMRTHTGPTSHWVEAGYTLGQHHTGLRQVTHWANITLG